MIDGEERELAAALVVAIEAGLLSMAEAIRVVDREIATVASVSRCQSRRRSWRCSTLEECGSERSAFGEYSLETRVAEQEAAPAGHVNDSVT
jgi:hypothetical protein